MLRWDLDPAAQIVHIIAPENLAMQLGRDVAELITHLHANEGYDVHLIPEVANHADEFVTWYATSTQPDIGDFLNSVFAMQTLADPRWKALTCRITPAGERYTLAQPTTQHASWKRIGDPVQFADLTATFTPLPSPAISFEAQLSDAPNTRLYVNDKPSFFEQWHSPNECIYYEKVMFDVLKQWAIIGIAGVPIVNIGVKLDHILYHEVDSSPRAFAMALWQACKTIRENGLLVPQTDSLSG